jgi:hypothetical protein
LATAYQVSDLCRDAEHVLGRSSLTSAASARHCRFNSQYLERRHNARVFKIDRRLTASG